MDQPTTDSSHGTLAHGNWLHCLRIGLTCYVLTSAIVVSGVILGQGLVKPGRFVRADRHELLSGFSAWDSDWYIAIANEGYEYDPTRQSRVAFYPLYPLIGRYLAQLTTIDTRLALLLVAHASLAACFVMAARYVEERSPHRGIVRRKPQDQADLSEYASFTLLALGLLPTTLFFRMAYTESLFLLLVIVVLYGIERAWPLPIIGLCIGLATATRATGLALVPALMLHIWCRSHSWPQVACRLFLYVPLACSGLLAFMAFQWLTFADPLTFVKTQQWWRARPPTLIEDKILDLIALEPIWTVLYPDSETWWGHGDDAPLGFFSYSVADPFCFLVILALLVFGANRRWLTHYELLAGLALLLIPYLGRGHEMAMFSSGRFAAVAFPAYLVAGNILARLHLVTATGILVFCGFWLGVYSALFASGHRVF